jgi:hypothetical protein
MKMIKSYNQAELFEFLVDCNPGIIPLKSISLLGENGLKVENIELFESFVKKYCQSLESIWVKLESDWNINWPLFQKLKELKVDDDSKIETKQVHDLW